MFLYQMRQVPNRKLGREFFLIFHQLKFSVPDRGLRTRQQVRGSESTRRDERQGVVSSLAHLNARLECVVFVDSRLSTILEKELCFCLG